MKKTYSVKRGERGKQGYRHMLLNITEEEIAEIKIQLDQYLKDHNKETVTNGLRGRGDRKTIMLALDKL